MDDLPPHVAAAVAEPCPESGSTSKVLLGLFVAATLAWTFWPVPAPTPAERKALAALGVTVMPPGKTVCPVTAVPLRWSPDVGTAIGYDRWLLLNKEGWRFFVPVTAPKSDVTAGPLGVVLPSSGPESTVGKVAESAVKLAAEV